MGRWLFGKRVRLIDNFYFKAYRDSNYCDARSIETIELSRRIFDSEPDKYLARFYRQSFGMAVYEATGLIQDGHMLERKEEGGRWCALVPTFAFLPLLRDKYQRPEFLINWGFGRGMVTKESRHLFSYIYRGGQAIGRILRGTQRRTAEENALPAISVLNIRGGKSSTQRNDLFWLKAPPSDHSVILEYAHCAYPLSQEFLADLASKKVRIVETYLRGPKVPGGERWRPGAVYLIHAVRALRHLVRNVFRSLASSGEVFLELWAAWCRFRFEMLVALRSDFYRAYHIKAEFMPGLTLAEPAHSRALSGLGGMTCTAQYSVGIDPVGSHTSVSDLHFHFGRHVESWNFPFEAGVSLAMGYLFKTPLTDEVEQVEALRTRLRRAGIRRSLLFLDEGFFYNDDLDRVTFRLCEYLMKKVQHEPDFGVLVKPKRNDAHHAFMSRLGDLYRDACVAGRFIILESSCYPGHAGQAVDLTVGLLSTAPFESALMGCRTIYLNPFGYLPKFMEPIRPHVFDDVPGMAAAIDQFFSGAGATLGEHTEPFLQSIDHYRDDQVSDRIHFLLRRFLFEIQQGKSREAALQATLAEFAQRWVPCWLGPARPMVTRLAMNHERPAAVMGQLKPETVLSGV
jgi:hypothetical protein